MDLALAPVTSALPLDESNALVTLHHEWAVTTARAFAWQRQIPLRKGPLTIEDIDHAAHLGLLKAARRYVPSKGTFKAFARRLIQFAVIDIVRETYRWRSHQRDLHQQEINAAIDPAELANELTCNDSGQDAVDNRDFVESLLDQLSGREKAIAQAYWLQGKTLVEIAAGYGLSQSAIHLSIHRSLATARELAQA